MWVCDVRRGVQREGVDRVTGGREDSIGISMRVDEKRWRESGGGSDMNQKMGNV